ncbi:MAG TPA: hypothetical protein VK453_15330 [Micromonosporaceae bacterium]|nr:hypothetical protein [Micromonosporaceae bacterium]
MTDEVSFVHLFREAAATSSNRSWLPGDLIEAWDQFVTFCADGYHDNIYEYTNDLHVRDTIEAVLRNEPLRERSEMVWFQEQVEQVDIRFRALLQEHQLVGPPERPWWRRHPPKYAGAELAADYLADHGVHVEVREP